MLSKTVGIIAVLALLMTPSTADAHQKHKHNKVRAHKPPAVVVTIGWTWIEATVFRPAHWRHPHYGRSYRAMNVGPPPPRPHAHAVWVPGHWEGRRYQRHWVPGHWRR